MLDNTIFKNKKLTLLKKIHKANNPIINSSIEGKIKMIEWFEELVRSQTDQKKIEQIVISKIDYYHSTNKNSMNIIETCEAVNKGDILQEIFYLYRSTLVQAKLDVL